MDLRKRLHNSMLALFVFILICMMVYFMYSRFVSFIQSV